jgi:PAS domain-containing protein
MHGLSCLGLRLQPEWKRLDGTSTQHQGSAPEWANANCRAVLEAAPDAMLVVNREGEIVAANRQAQKLYRYGHEQLTGRVVESLIPARLRHRPNSTSLVC